MIYSIMNPYDVLGLQPSCSITDVKRAYKKLAFENHPDKLYGDSSVSECERKEKEEIFKNVTVAYHLLLQEHSSTDAKHSPEYWKDVWVNMENFVSSRNVWSTVFDVATKYIKTKRHRVCVPVTLHEIYDKKDKKVEFILKGVDDPILQVICCGDYPTTSFSFEDSNGRHHYVSVQFEVKQHDVYVMDDYDLYTYVAISWDEYLNGCVIELPYVDGKTLAVTLPPCIDLSDNFILHGKGMDKEHHMFIDVRLQSISHSSWSSLSAREQCRFIATLKKIQQT